MPSNRWGSRLWIKSAWLGGSPLETTEQQVRDILQPAMARKRAFMPGIISPVEIGAYYAAADVFVLPSMFQETFGLVVLEAFSAGLPVIAFRSGGFPNSSNIDGTGFCRPRRRGGAAQQHA